MSKKAQVYILCEDKNHYYFARHYFKLKGYQNIIGKYNPAGKGSGADFVTKNYEKKHSAFCNRKSCIFVVIIDDDTRNRIQDLYNTYTPSKNDSILIFSPIRNIESWFHYIDTGDFNVENNKDKNYKIVNYKSQYESRSPTEFAKKLKEEICSSGLPNNAPSSLHHACKELNRIKS